MDLASVVAALASVGVRVSGSNPNNNIQEDSSRACPTGLAGPEPSGTHIDPGQHFHGPLTRMQVLWSKIDLLSENRILACTQNILPIYIWRSYMHYPGKTSDMPRM